jgi:FMN-dependent NADH-azoreductase
MFENLPDYRVFITYRAAAMSHLLVLHNSINLDASITRELAASLAEKYLTRVPGGRVVERDLVKEPVPHMPPELRALQLGAPEAEEPDMYAVLAEALITELEQADEIVIGVPMYSFTVPSTLKTWIDYIVRAKRTFAYVDGAPKGLLPEGKKVVLLIASGGIYSSGAAQAFDFTETYLRAALGFVGITDVRVVRAEAQGKSGDVAASSRDAAREQVALM